MRYDRDLRRGRGPNSDSPRNIYGADYRTGGPLRRERYYGEGPERGYGSRGPAGPRESGGSGYGRDEFRFGGGYVGGRGYGGTNYDLNHGYRIGSTIGQRGGDPATARPHPRQSGGSTRGGYEFSEYDFDSQRGHDHSPAAREVSSAYPASRSRSGGQGGAGQYGRGGQQAGGSGRGGYGEGPYSDRLERRERGDDQLKREIEDALFYDTWVDADRIEVRVQSGVVTLSGTLGDYQEVRFATDDAWNIDGVRGVRSQLEVEEDGQRSSQARGSSSGSGQAATGGGNTPARGSGEIGSRVAQGGAAGLNAMTEQAGGQAVTEPRGVTGGNVKSAGGGAASTRGSAAGAGSTGSTGSGARPKTAGGIGDMEGGDPQTQSETDRESGERT